MKKYVLLFTVASLALSVAPALGQSESEAAAAAAVAQQQFPPGVMPPPWAMRGPGMGGGFGYGGGSGYGMGMAGYWMPPGMMGYAGAMQPPYIHEPMFRPYGAPGGPLVGSPAQQFGMGPGMVSGLGMTGYISNEAFQKFFDETRETRKQLHDLMFDYTELLRKPNPPVDKRVEMENKIQALRQKIYEKAPRYQF